MAAVKICGVCSPADAAQVARAGADYIGVILAPGRARTQTDVEAAEVFAAAAGVKRVGVFVNENPAVVRRLAVELQLDVVQLHGDETPAAVVDSRLPPCAVWKAVRVRSVEDVERALVAYQDVADALLLDGWSADAVGGAGVAFDWREVATLRAQWPALLQVVAAGGLRPDNVTEAIAALTPDVVDVSTGVEAALCVKSAEKVREFVAAAHTAAHGRQQL